MQSQRPRKAQMTKKGAKRPSTRAPPAKTRKIEKTRKANKTKAKKASDTKTKVKVKVTPKSTKEPEKAPVPTSISLYNSAIWNRVLDQANDPSIFALCVMPHSYVPRQ